MTRVVRWVAGIACLLLVASGIRYWGHKPAPDVPPAVTKTADSLRATAPAFDSAATAGLAGVDRQVDVDRRLAARERALRALDATLQARKDSLALAAAAHPDSALAWQAAYVAADSLATARQLRIDTLLVRVDTLTASRDTALVVAENALERLRVTEGVVVGLRAAVAKMRGRTPLDYVALGCGVGLRGPDCIVGVRIPLGRK